MPIVGSRAFLTDILQESLYSEMEHVETYENELDYGDANAESRKGSMEMVAVADLAEPLDVNPAHNCAGSDDDMNFFDDDLSE